MMMNFCKNSVHSFLGFSSTLPINIDCIEKPKSFNNGLYLQGLVTATGDVYRPPNVVESSSVKSPPSPAAPEKKDPGGIGFMDEMGGDVNGLMSCTESLGFESSDERRMDDSMEEVAYLKTTSCSPSRLKLKRLEGKREGKQFPPPLSSLYHDGQPSFFLRPVRKDGRLELTEVRIDRPSLFHAHREDGRLRLHIVEEEEEEEYDDDDVDMDETEEEVETKEENSGGGKDEEKVINETWMFEEFKRCNQNHNHHHNLHVWSQHCATRG